MVQPKPPPPWGFRRLEDPTHNPPEHAGTRSRLALTGAQLARADTVAMVSIFWFEPPDPPDARTPEGRLQLAVAQLALEELRETGHALIFADRIRELGDQHDIPVHLVAHAVE